MSRSLRYVALAALTCGACGLLPAGLAAAAPSVTTVTSIHALLGGGHVSPFAGQAVSGVPGIVTEVTSDEFFIQAPEPVDHTPFKQAIAVFTGKKPAVVAGDSVTVAGTVSEFFPDQSDTPSALPVAEIDDPVVTVVSAGNPLPAPVVIGSSGVLPPAQNIFTPLPTTSTDVDTVTSFAPFLRALDFYQGLDSTLVEVQDPVAIEPENGGSFAVAPDNGAGAGLRTAAGGLADFGPGVVNARRLAVFPESGVKSPAVNTGDHFSGPVEGIMSEFEGNPELELTSATTAVSSGLAPQVAPAARAGQLTVATYNVDNLSPKSGAAKFARLGHQIAVSLGAPDILGIQEIQDNDGSTDDGVVAADVTLGDLTAAITAAGGPAYSWTEIDPVNDADGGQPGGNIRQVILYRTDTGLAFDAAPGGSATAADSVTGSGASTALAQSPGRIDPSDVAWSGAETLTDPSGSGRTMPGAQSRKPLAAQFTWQGHSIFVINNHLTAKLQDDADFGRYQPPVLFTEIQRTQQAQILHAFVQSIEQASPRADVIVMGDMNDQGFSPTFSALEAGGALVDPVSRLPLSQRYDYVFDGDSETLSGLLVSPALAPGVTFENAIHINANFTGQTSDHDPLLAYLTLPK
jgi:predicted extracellular nuclease